MSRSVRSQPRDLRAARRALFPRVRGRKPSPGRFHPAGLADVRFALERFGAEAYYGVRLVELVPARPQDRGLVFGRLAGPGHIVLYDQPPSPWRLGEALTDADRLLLESAGADVTSPGVVLWRDDKLKRFMLGYVLTHELGHHTIQHERRLRGERAARTRDHEARAELIAGRLRDRLP